MHVVKLGPVILLLLATLFSCTSPRRPSTLGERDPATTARFLDVLQTGGKLFGLGTGCDEWKVAPDPKGESHCESAACVSGQFESEIEDGKIYGFSYMAVWGDRNTVLTLMSRGGWSPAPGVVIPANDPAHPGTAIIGRARMCIEMVGVGDNPLARDAVVVGDEPWYLTKESCIRVHGGVRARRGCGATSPTQK